MTTVQHRGPSFAENEVIERIEAFRKRRPRLLDEIVTMSHGAGGKSSAALVDAVFVEGFRNERLFNYLNNNGIWETEKRIKLAFACLLTAVGVPMILAGEEFADPQNHRAVFPDKELGLEELLAICSEKLNLEETITLPTYKGRESKKEIINWKTRRCVGPCLPTKLP